MSTLKIGVVGYCPPTQFDEHKANELLLDALQAVQADHPDARDFWIVSGLCDVGVPALAYRAASVRGWKTSGIACAKAVEYECFDVDDRKIVGENWGDESETFLEEIDVIVRIGGGQQSHAEVKAFVETGGRAYEYELATISS